MNVWGIVLAFFAALLGVVFTAFSAKVTKTRGELMQAYQKQEDLFKKQEEELARKQKQLQTLKVELDRTMIPWDRYWSPVPAGVANPATGELTANFGTVNGLKDKMAVHAFAKMPDNSYFYVGPFEVKKANDATSSLVPRWRLRANESANWPRGDWRFRSMIPAQYEGRFVELEKELLIADTLFTASTNELARQEKLITLANDHLKLRLAEINGAEDLQGRELPIELIKGYLTTMVDEEELRNQLAVEVADLRKQLLDTNLKIQQVLRHNSGVIRALRETAPTEPAGSLSSR